MGLFGNTEAYGQCSLFGRLALCKTTYVPLQLPATTGETPPPEFVLIDEPIGGLQFLASG